MKFPLILGVVIVVVLFVTLFALPARTDHVEEYVPIEKHYNISISTDQYTYHSRDTIQIVIKVIAPEYIENADLRFFGVENKYGAYKVKRNMKMNLTEGLNVIETKSNIPSCTGCSGITPGLFQVYAALYENDTQIINASTEIEVLK